MSHTPQNPQNHQSHQSRKKLSDLTREDCEFVLDGRAEALAPLKNETIVITGGSGFMGAWLAETIACLNDRYAFGVKAVFISRKAKAFQAKYPHLGERKDFEYVSTDVRNLVELPRETGWLIHAAGNPDSRFHSSNPVETMTSIADGTATVLREASRCSGFKKALNLSSALIYGVQPFDVEAVAETYKGAPLCGSVFSSYAEAKRYAETLCAAVRSQSRIPIVTARPFAFLGPYQSIETPWAINNFIKDAFNGGPINVKGDGQTVRSYLYGADCAYWLLKILVNGTEGSAYNVGSARAITLENLAGLVSRQFGSRPLVKLRTLTEAVHRSRMVPDVTAATQSLGLTETITLEKAIERTTLWNQLIWQK